MLKLETSKPLSRANFLRRLRRYSANEVLLNNAYRHMFVDLPSWSSWIEETFTELLQMPSGSELHITLRNELDSEQLQTFVFTQSEVSIGRAAESDISLPLQSISRHHARIVEKEGDFFLEDMGSVSGTYLNRRKLAADHPCRLNAGDEVLLFPYALQVEPKDLWRPDDTVRVIYSPERTPLHAQEFASRFGSETCLFQIGVHPELQPVLLAISRPLVTIIIARLLRTSVTSLVESDAELLEFIAACVLEHANRALHFPFECSLAVLPEGQDIDEVGLGLSASITLSEAHGSVRVFVPETLLKKTPPSRKALPVWMKSSLRWQLPLRIGQSDIQLHDLEQIEIGDIVLYTPTTDLVLPARHGFATQRGWRVTPDARNASRFTVQHFHEWSTAMAADEMHPDTNTETGIPDLSALPVRVQVVLARVDMNLESLENVRAGTIIQLDADTSGTVQLIVGDTVLGAGDLVELDGERLGVQITQWREK